MKYLKAFEGTNYTYRIRIRRAIEYIQSELIKNGMLDINDKYSNMLLTLIPTNNITESKFGNIISDNFEKNVINLITNIDKIIPILVNTNIRGLWGELLVKFFLEKKYKLTVTETTKDEDISGVDLKTINNTHQVKIINNYVDTENYSPNSNGIFTINSYIDIKKTDKYDYLWFFVKDTNEIIGFNHKDIHILSHKNNYSINYKNINKFNISELTSIDVDDFVIRFKEKARIILKGKGDKLIQDIQNIYGMRDYNI